MVQRSDEGGEPRDEGVAGDGPPDRSGDAPGPAATGGSAVPPRDDQPADFDERWAQIVAELGEPDEAVAEQPDSSPAPDDGAGGRGGGHVVRPAGEERALSGRDWAGSDQYEAAEEAVDALEHFVPPDPGPVLGSDPLRTLTWGVAVGVPVLYVVLLVAWRGAPGWLAPVAGVAFVAALAVLIWRMPHRRDTDGDDDSGAVV